MGWRFWVELLIRSGTVLIACEGLRRFARRTDAAERYRIGLAAFGLLALLPFLTALLPAIPIGIFGGTRAIVTVETGPLVAAGAVVSQGSSWHIDWFLLVVWSIGVALGLGRLVTGQIAIRRLAGRSTPVREGQILDLVRELSAGMGLKRAPAVLMLAKPIIPVTFGILRTKILLPADCSSWSASRWHVVLLHELAHIERRDLAAQWFAGATCALWWFQPLAWRARKTLREESERACDAQVMAAGMRASEYATELLAIARGAQAGLASIAAIGMASGRLEARLHAILRHEIAPRSRMRGFTAILTLLVFGTAASAIDLGGSPMKRTILSSLLFSAGLSAATISGTVLDPSGAAIPNASILLINPDTSAQQQALSMPDGKFSFDELAAGQYILRVKKPGFADLFREYTVRPDTTLAKALIMQVGRVEQEVTIEGKGKAATAEVEPSLPPLRIGGRVMAAKLIKKVPPVYPAAEKTAGVQGKVTMDAVILKDGTPASLAVVSSPSPALSESALNAVRQWRYRPVLLNGNPVEVTTTIVVDYQLVP